MICDLEVRVLVVSGEGVVINGVLYKDEEDWLLFEEEESKSKGEMSMKVMEMVM